MTIPGINLSILRQSTTIEAGKPLLISGRLTIFGIGVPALIRVYVEGPKYDPAVRHFDTFASPFTGDYSVNVLAEKDGEYDVYAQAYPPFPSLPLLPEPVIGPPLGESPKPPIVVGTPTVGGLIETITGAGKQAIAAPAPVYIEVPYVVEVPARKASAAPVSLPTPPPPVEVLEPLAKQAYLHSVTFSPFAVTSGDIATGELDWENVGGEDTSYDVNLYLIDLKQNGYGPFKLTENTVVPSGYFAETPISIDTEDLPIGVYSARIDFIDAKTGKIVTSRIAGSLQILEPPITDIEVTFPDLEVESGGTVSGTIIWSPV